MAPPMNKGMAPPAKVIHPPRAAAPQPKVSKSPPKSALPADFFQSGSSAASEPENAATPQAVYGGDLSAASGSIRGSIAVDSSEPGIYLLVTQSPWLTFGNPRPRNKIKEGCGW